MSEQRGATHYCGLLVIAVGVFAVGAPALASIHGSDSRSIHGSDSRSIHGSDGRSIHGSDGRSIHGSDGRS
ncbi:MAG: hypothetical protein HOI35_05665, partial [Woeseia sp.]|nr:hypothetical protein [Woeseia sp.]